MKTRTAAASPAPQSALALEILEFFKPPVTARRAWLSRIGKPNEQPPATPRTEAEIALDKAREDWIRAHNARLRKAREALQKKIAIAREARGAGCAKDGPDTGVK